MRDKAAVRFLTFVYIEVVTLGGKLTFAVLAVQVRQLQEAVNLLSIIMGRSRAPICLMRLDSKPAASPSIQTLAKRLWLRRKLITQRLVALSIYKTALPAMRLAVEVFRGTLILSTKPFGWRLRAKMVPP